MKKFLLLRITSFAIVVLLLLLTSCRTADDEIDEPDLGLQEEQLTADEQNNIFGEIIYVPVYSSIFYSDKKRTIELAATLSIHNTDLEKPIRITKVDYFNLKGRLIRKFLDSTVELKPLETTNFVIEEKDKSGGTGANFIVHWVADGEVSTPIVEAIMISTMSAQGISFTTTGKVIKRIGSQ